MTSPTGRVYAVVSALLVLFVAWAVIAARPWSGQSAPARDPRLAALQVQEARVRHEALVVRRTVERRWAVYRVRLVRRNREIAQVERRHREQLAAARRVAAAAASAPSYSSASAPSYSPAAPSVSVVTLPPVTVTRSS